MFLTKFQSMKALIHILYKEMEELLWRTMSKFVKSKHISNQTEDGTTRKTPAIELLELDVYNKKNMKPVKMVDIGTKAKSLFLPSPLELDEKEEVFQKDYLNCMGLKTEDARKKLPLNSFFRNFCYIQLRKRNDKNALESITCIAQDISKALSQVLVNVPEEICDAFRSEWMLYQAEEIKEEHCCCTIATVSGRNKALYWENTFLIAGLENISESNAVSKFDIEKLVYHIGNLRNSTNIIKYPIFSAFMKCVLSISHGSSVPESGFSINKHILDIHGHSLKEDTIETLTVLKDAILYRPSLLNVPVIKEMLRSVKALRQRYQVDLEAARK